MNEFVVTGALCLAWLALALLVARRMHATRKDRTMIDLLERKLDDLDGLARAGRITEHARQSLARALLDHADLVCQMEQLVTCAGGEALHAELVATLDAPELHIDAAAGTIHHWLARLRDLDFQEVGITDLGYEFRGPYVVRIRNCRSVAAPLEAAA